MGVPNVHLGVYLHTYMRMQLYRYEAHVPAYKRVPNVYLTCEHTHIQAHGGVQTQAYMNMEV